MSGILIEDATATAEAIEAVRALWREYWASFGLDENFQGFRDEALSLPGLYAPPSGRLLLARIAGDNAQPAGTVALRPLASRPQACEAKRLYVRPAFRGRGIAAALLRAAIDQARACGYRELYGDTLPQMNAALGMYLRMGFREIEPYSESPTAGAIYLRLDL